MFIKSLLICPSEFKSHGDVDNNMDFKMRQQYIGFLGNTQQGLGFNWS